MTNSSSDRTDAFLQEVATLVFELNPHLRDRVRVTMESSLDRELSLDSLARAELASRLERRFDCTLPATIVASADSVRELYHALGVTAPQAQAVSVVAHASASAGSAPNFAQTGTLIDVLHWHMEVHPQRVHVHYLDEQGAVSPLTYADLGRGAHAVAAGLLARGLERGQSVALMLPSGNEYLFSFFGVLLAGCVPVPIYPPARPSQLEEHVRRHARLLTNANVAALIGFEQAKPVARLLTSLVASLRVVVTASEVAQHAQRVPRPQISADSTAFLQYTSGSTGDPKGVVLSHGDLLSSLDAMHRGLRVRDDDVFVSWLPLYHDMGLIGAWLGSLTYAMPFVLMSPLTFLAKPLSWLKAIETFGGTLSGGPNFAYELCMRRIDDAQLASLNLSSWRVAFNGAEPISAETISRFTERFAVCGLPPTAMTPVYGLAEATLGVAFTPSGRGARVESISRDAMRNGHARLAQPDEDAIPSVSCGIPIPGFEVRIVDSAGQECMERHEGRLQFKGPSTTSGYFANPAATAALFDGDWVESGDRAYVAEGNVFLTGRSKDVIIRGGRNLYPYELELAVAEIEGVRRGCVAVFGAVDKRNQTESLVVLAETKERDDARLAEMRAEIEQQANMVLGVPADDVLLVAPQTVLKTSSGKIRRAVLRDLYERDALKPGSRSVQMQFLRLQLHALAPTLRQARKRITDVTYAVYVGVMTTLVALLLGALALVLPNAATRWSVLHTVTRTLFKLLGISLHVSGLENVPERGPFVLVSNHCSYADVVALVATLPRGVGFVAKRELASVALIQKVLERIGTKFVERFDKEQSARDAESLVAALSSGEPLAFFPEGTFHRMPGLLAFQMGAFHAAASADVPIIPVTLRGTRSILRGDTFFARRGRIKVTILPAIKSQSGEVDAARSDRGWTRALTLRNTAREIILQHCGEPNLIDRQVLLDLEQAKRES